MHYLEVLQIKVNIVKSNNISYIQEQFLYNENKGTHNENYYKKEQAFYMISIMHLDLICRYIKMQEGVSCRIQ